MPRNDTRRSIAVRPLQGDLTYSLIRSLRERSVRDSNGLLLAEGVRFLVSAADHGAVFAGLATCARYLTSPVGASLARQIQSAGVPCLNLHPAQYEDLVSTPEPQGIVAIFRQAFEPLPDAVRHDDLWIAVESIRSPGNLGTIIRSGDAAGATGLVVFDRSAAGSPSGVDPYDPSCVRATMGSIFALRHFRVTHREFRKWRLRWETTVVGADLSAHKDFRAVSYRRPVVLMLGDERSGLSPGQKGTCDLTVRIPMAGDPDSLNVAMAATVLLYEAYGQRHPVRRQ